VPGPRPPDGGETGGARTLARSSGDYPAGLRDLRDAPEHVYVLGAPLPTVARAVAIVGSRAASPYGMEQSTRLAGDLARLGFVVVSGLARGIDAAAHRGAVAAGGRTVAVLPGGLESVTPRHHLALAAEIATRGALLSEVPHGGPATVVVEAAIRSGALSTAAAARRLGRAVLAVPGDIDRETARGCHQLLRQGAKLCERASDVLAAMDGPPARAHEGIGPAVPAEAKLLAALDGVPRTVDALAVATGLDAPQALAALLALQWSGVASPRPGQRWVRSGA